MSVELSLSHKYQNLPNNDAININVDNIYINNVPYPPRTLYIVKYFLKKHNLS